MISRARIAVAILAIGVASAAIVPSAWRYRQRIVLTPGEALAVVKLDREIYTRTLPDLADLRVVRDGEEIPYVVEIQDAGRQRREQAGEIVDQSVAPDLGLQFTVHLAGTFQHNRVRIETGERNFRQAVRIETSEDGRRWSVARTDGAIFDFSQGDRHLASLSVGYPVSTRPFLRVTVRGWTKVGAVTGARVVWVEQRPAGREALATLTPQAIQDSSAQATLITLDIGVGGLPVDMIRIETPTPLFHRAVDVETSADAAEWRYLTQGVIARLPGEEALAIQIPEARSRYLRLKIYNRDDRPISVNKVELQGLVRRVKFPAAKPGTYWLYSGNPEAHTPVYDLPILLSKRERVEEAVWNTAAAEANPDYHPPVPPWSERHPTILYAVLGGVVLALAVATLRFALRLRTPAS